ncbi:SIMPL domain-containing protein [Dactylosporangium cerinum]|uniref:SIMPL domain-containing protein n=1 Tax=Dactylosporangium cerinum TaxID=1434730 RepID=A0ABV9W3B5_9ACTN
MTVVAVRGEATREVDPELAEFTVVVSARDKDRQTTLTRLRERADALRELLDRHGEAVERRETSGLHVHAEMGKKGERVTAYSGSVVTTVTVHDFAALGELLLTVANQDQTHVDGPRWSLRPDSPVHKEVRRAAVADAIARGKEYAEALGAQVVDLLELSDPGLGAEAVPLGFFQSYDSRAKSGAAYGGAPLQLDPQRQRVRAVVEARFTITTPVLGA